MRTHYRTPGVILGQGSYRRNLKTTAGTLLAVFLIVAFLIMLGALLCANN